jgi:hypothetical protein
MEQHMQEHENREHEHRTAEQDGATDGDRSRNGWVARSSTARRHDWASDRILDPGDSHDKGEASLCVGEAA